jgi:hypothetical protein
LPAKRLNFGPIVQSKNATEKRPEKLVKSGGLSGKERE